MKKFVFILCLLLPLSAFARNADEVLPTTYGAIPGCIEVSTTTTGHNRSAQLEESTQYILYGTDNTAVGTFEAIQCAQGGSTIDVTNLPSSMKGLEVAAGEKVTIYTGLSFRYVSCISSSATKHYRLCKQVP